jgi:hypothetical protein
MTLADYLTIPRDDRHTLLLYGDMIEIDRPGAKRDRASKYLGLLLDRWIRSLKEGSVHFGIDIVLDSDKALVHAPDLSFVTTPDKRRFKGGRLFGPAELCVDIVDGSQRGFVLSRKFADYQRYGVRWYWRWHLDRNPSLFEECHLVNGRFECRSEIVDDQWFEPGLIPGLVFRLPPLLDGDLKAAVKGKAKRLM